MGRRVLPIAVVCFSAFAPGLLSVKVQAQSAGTWNKRAKNAEAREDYDTAYEGYRKARLKAPNDLRYKTSLERVRVQAAAVHVDRGRVLRQSGDLNGAITEFTRALMIDAGDQVAQQEINITQRQQQAVPAAPGPSADVTQRQSDAISALGNISGVIQLKPVSNDPITLHMVEDTKVIYQAIGKAAGLNVLFDPDYTSKRIPVDLTNVSLSDALRIVGTIAGTFTKTVTANTIFVAQNTRTKRTDLEEVAVQTFYLNNASQQADATEVLTAIRNLLDPSVKVYLVPSQNAIVMRATPDQLLLAQKLLNDLDRAKPEVIVDVAILEVSRDKLRNIGITWPNSITLTPQVAGATTSTSNDGSDPTPSTATTNLTLNNLAHLNANNFGVTITGGTLNAILTDNDTRVLQNPKIRATDGQRATLKIGSKIPTATGSYNAGVSTGIASIGVQTQFTYLDIGVNIDMTPTVHYDHEISLKMKIEVSTHSSDVTISNVTEPVISQRVSEQTIQLKEGEPSILAGLLEKTETRLNSGYPGLAEVPWLKYLFGSQSKEVLDDEVVFVLIPHIVRESILTRLNTRAIDTGTGASVELRRDPNPREDVDAYIDPSPRRIPSDTSAANAASSMLLQIQQQAQRPALPPDQSPAVHTPQAAPATPPTTAPAVDGVPVSLSVTPANSSQTVGSTFQVSVMLNNGHDVYSVPLQMQFDPKVLDLVNVDSGDFLGHDGQAVALVHRDEGNGLVTISSSRPPGVAGVNGQGNVCTLTFKAKAAGDSTLSLVKVGAKNSAQANLPAVGSQAVVHVR